MRDVEVNGDAENRFNYPNRRLSQQIQATLSVSHHLIKK
jgi:hypothetical protein